MGSLTAPQTTSFDGRIIIDEAHEKIEFLDTSNRPVAQFGLQTDGTLSLKYFDSTGLEIGSFGQQTDGTVELRFFDSSGIGVAKFGRNLDGTTSLDIAQQGIEVTTATADQKVLSSTFNMYKIIASGEITPNPRLGTVTLDSVTNIGYMFLVGIDTGLTSTEELSGPLLLRVYWASTYSNINDAGLFYDDGTNIAYYKYDYFLSGSIIYIEFKIRCTAGTLDVIPQEYFNGAIYWDVCNNTLNTYGGKGAGGGSSGKYYYYDTMSFDSTGNITTALVSLTQEFGMNWPTFPYSDDY